MMSSKCYIVLNMHSFDGFCKCCKIYCCVEFKLLLEYYYYYYYCLENLDYSTALKNIKDNYCEITNLSIDSMLGKLFSKDVITLGQKKQIKACSAIESERMEYFLDNIIIPSLNSENIFKFKGLLETMKESGDCALISMAKKLGND